MEMHNPPHPGIILKELCIDPLGLSITVVAKALGVTRKTLSSIINGNSGISPEMALRLAKAFDTSPESWLSQQQQYDLWKAKKKMGKLKIKKLLTA
jgi:addiction module HigA family antidote